MKYSLIDSSYIEIYNSIIDKIHKSFGMII